MYLACLLSFSVLMLFFGGCATQCPSEPTFNSTIESNINSQCSGICVHGTEACYSDCEDGTRHLINMANDNATAV